MRVFSCDTDYRKVPSPLDSNSIITEYVKVIQTLYNGHIIESIDTKQTKEDKVKETSINEIRISRSRIHSRIKILYSLS